MRTPWTVYQIERLKELYPTTPADKLIEIVGHCTNSIYSKTSRLGIKANLLTRGVKYPSEEDIKKIETLKDIEKAYIAGIIDGEGTFHIFPYKDRSGIVCCLQISNTHKRLLDWIATKIPSSKVVPKKVKEDRKPAYELRLYGIAKVKHLIKTLLPYMIVKREDGIKVLQYHSKYTPEDSTDIPFIFEIQKPQ